MEKTARVASKGYRQFPNCQRRRQTSPPLAPLIALRTDDQCARNLAEAIDDLYRHDAAAQFERAFSLGQLCEGQRNEEGH